LVHNPTLVTHSHTSTPHLLSFLPCPKFCPKNGTDFSADPDSGLVAQTPQCQIGCGPPPIKEKAEMRRQIRNFVGLAVLLTAISANAQFYHQARVTVPFSFMAAGKSSPPGDYRVNIDRERDVVMLATDGSNPIMFLTYSPSQVQDGRTYLRFHRYGEKWFLEQVAVDGLIQHVPIAKRAKDVFTASTTGNGGPLSADIAMH
jgi:hypothetical protein